MGGRLTRTVSGEIASFKSADVMPMSVTAQIEPVQSGTGDPSPTNVRPIMGWTAAEIANAGNNIFDNSSADWVVNKYIDASGSIVSNNAYRYTNSYTNVKPGANYAIQYNKTSSAETACTVAFYDKNKNFISRVIAVASTRNTGIMSGTFTTVANTSYIRFSIGESTNSIQIIEKNIYTIPFPSAAGTVYGGSLTVNEDGTGTLSVDRVNYVFDGSEDEDWSISGTDNNYALVKVNDTKIYENNQIISNMYPQGAVSSGSNTDVVNCIYGSSIKQIISIRPSWMDNNTTASEIKSFLASNNLQAVVTLIDPIEYSLTAAEVGKLTAMQGINNVWADTGNVSATYNFCDHLFRKRQTLLNPHIETASGNVASFKTGVSAKLKQMTIDMQYAQNLRGFDNAWMGGYVPNMIPDGKDTNKGYVSGKYLTSDGTETSATYSSTYISEYFSVTAETTYTISLSKPTFFNTASVCFYDTNKNFLSGEAYAKRSSFTVTSPVGAEYCRCSQSGALGYDVRTVQMELGSTATTILPYSNICPIKGFYQSINVNVCNRNLMTQNFTVTTGKVINDEGKTSSIANYLYTNEYTPVCPNTQYTFSITKNSSESTATIIAMYDVNKEFIIRDYVANATTDTGTVGGAFTTTADTYFIRASYDTTGTNAQLEKGDTITSYVAPAKTEFTLAMPDVFTEIINAGMGTLTVYSDGTATFIRTWRYIVLTGSESWSRQSTGESTMFRLTGNQKCYSASESTQACSHFKYYGVATTNTGLGYRLYTSGSNASSYLQIRPLNSSGMTKEQWTQWLADQYNNGTPVTICYRTAIQNTYSLTEQQVKTILGDNRIWTDAGTISDLKYWKQ